MSLLRRVKHRLLCLTSGAGDSDGHAGRGLRELRVGHGVGLLGELDRDRSAGVAVDELSLIHI